MASNDDGRPRDEETADTAVARPAPPRPEGAAGGPPGLARGTTLGRYVVLHHLGSGGVGMVYAAYDPELDRKVAIKLLRDDLFHPGDEDGGQARLLREAQALARLSHPNVLTVFDVGTFQDQVFVATELVEGCTLKDWLRQKPRGWKEVLKRFLDAGRGLAAAHATGLVHRDVKPENVLLGDDGRIRVMDFGLARTAVVPSTEDASPGAAEAAEIPMPDGAAPSEVPTIPGLLSSGITHTGSLMGTPAYMAPEQYRTGALDARTDQFGFCVALYEGLYGERPFTAESPHLLVVKVSKGEINDPPPGKRVPPWLRQIVLRGLSRRPEDRYPSMEALLRDLEAAPKRARRRWWAAAALALLVVIALGVRQLLAPSPWLRPGEVTRVALLPFHNATGDPRNDWVEVGLTEMVAQTLNDTRGIDVVPPAQVQAALEDLNLGTPSESAAARSLGAAWSPEALERFQAALGSHLVVTTSVTEEHELFKLHYAMLGAGASQRLRTVQGSELMASASQLASRLSRLLNPQAPPQSLEQHFSDDPFVNRAFAVGLQQLTIGGPKVAEHYFEVCLDQDPSLDRARLALVRVRMNQGDFDRGEALLATVLESAERLGDRGLVAEALNLRGSMARLRGELEQAAVLIARAWEIHRELAESDQVIDDLTALGRVAQDRGEWDQARSRYEQALELARELGARSAEAELVRHLGLVALLRGDLDRAEQRLRQALESYREQGHRRGTALVLGNLGVVLMDQGRLAESESLLRQEHELHVQMGDHSEGLVSLANLTEIARLSDEHEKCHDNAGKALALLTQHESPITEVHLRAARAYCLLRSAEVPASETALRHASEVAEQIENPLPRAVVALAWADHHAYLGRAREAESWLPPAEAWLERSPGWDLASDLYRIRARIAYLRGRFPEAVDNIRRARELAGPAWRPYDQKLLDAYERSARSGRPQPLP